MIEIYFSPADSAMDNGNESVKADVVPMHRPCSGHFSDFCLNGVCRVEPISGIFYCNCTPPYEGKRCEYFSLRVTGSAKWWSLGHSQWVGFTVFGVIGILFLSCVIYYTVIRKRNYKRKNHIRRRINTADSWLTMYHDANNNQICKLTTKRTMDTCTVKIQYDDDNVEHNAGRSLDQNFVVANEQDQKFTKVESRNGSYNAGVSKVTTPRGSGYLGQQVFSKSSVNLADSSIDSCSIYKWDAHLYFGKNRIFLEWHRDRTWMQTPADYLPSNLSKIELM